MPPTRAGEPSPPAGAGDAVPGLAARILWPAFLMAGVLEALTFAVVDPDGLAWFGGAPLALSRPAVYTITFFLYWGVISTSGALTALLAVPPEPLRGRHHRPREPAVDAALNRTRGRS